MKCEHGLFKQGPDEKCNICPDEQEESTVALSEGLEGPNERIEELEKWIVDCRDKILYPLAHENTTLGKIAEGFGASTIELLKKAD